MIISWLLLTTTVLDTEHIIFSIVWRTFFFPPSSKDKEHKEQNHLNLDAFYTSRRSKC